MLERLLQIDKDILISLNQTNSPLWDNFFQIYTSAIVWIPFYILIAAAIIYRQHAKGLITLLFIALIIVICDQMAASVIKNTIERLRPSHEPSLYGIIRLLNNQQAGKFGFVSAHAANSFCVAMFTTLLFKKWNYGIFIFIWAIVNSYSRIYLGLHYPSDIIGGLIVGVTISSIMYVLYRKLIYYHINGFQDIANYKNETLIPLIGGILSISMIFLCAKVLLNT